MAQETKVGLLTGLAFIVCFAVILTNRGNERFDNEDFGLPPDASSTRAASPARHAADLNRIVQREPTAPRADRRRPLEASNTAPGSNPSTATLPVWRPPAEPEANLADRSLADADANPARSSTRRDRLEQRLDELAAEVRNQRSANSAHAHKNMSGTPDPSRSWTESPPAALSAPSARKQADPGGMQYTVVSGDSLSKIARLFYGTGSRTVVNAIFDVNRAVLPSADQLRAGLSITLPAVTGFDGPRADLLQPPPASPAAGQQILRPERSQPPDTRWYEIRKNDRYAKIAREQLGDESRWREIFELNKDKFPHPGMIRPGVRIRLPGRRVASAGSNRH